VHVGDLIRANDTTPLVVINQLSPIYVAFSVPGRFLADVQRYQARRPLSVTAAPPEASGTGGAPARGVLSFIDNAVDSTTGTIRLKATFPNGDHQLWPGAFVQVTLGLTTQPDAIVVPVTAVQTSQDGSFVYVVRADRTVEMRPVKISRQAGGEAVVDGGRPHPAPQRRRRPGAHRAVGPSAEGDQERGIGEPAGNGLEDEAPGAGQATRSSHRDG